MCLIFKKKKYSMCVRNVSTVAILNFYVCCFKSWGKRLKEC